MVGHGGRWSATEMKEHGMTRETENRYEMFAKNFGLRPSGAPACPRVAAGRRCRADDRCICRRHWWALDHGRCWLDGDGGHVVTGEPYGFPADEQLRALLDELEELGVELHVDGQSPHFPGFTVLLRFGRGAVAVQPPRVPASPPGGAAG